MSESPDATGARVDETVDAVVEAIAAATPEVRSIVTEHRGYAGSANPSGERQLAADVRADRLFAERMLAVDGVASYASEERDDVLDSDGGDLHVAMDPLDGSSNLEPNAGMGTIFGVYATRPPAAGRDLLAAGFVSYGPVTSLVVARDGRVREYVLREGEPRLVDDDVTIPREPTVYGFGGGVDSWTDDFRAFAAEVREELKLRYGGAMVADVSQVLAYGGIFAYPALRSAPDGKLRLQFEGQPIGFVVETAGGRSSDGERSLLEREPDDLHARTPLHVGNEALIDRLETALE